MSGWASARLFNKTPTAGANKALIPVYGELKSVAICIGQVLDLKAYAFDLEVPSTNPYKRKLKNSSWSLPSAWAGE